MFIFKFVILAKLKQQYIFSNKKKERKFRINNCQAFVYQILFKSDKDKSI